MPFVNSRELLLEAQEQRYALGAFNVENMEMMQAVIKAAEAERAPVIIQTTPSTIKYADAATFAAMARTMADRVDVPVAIHLDHGNSFALCKEAADAGYTSLMIDGSGLPIEENIAITRSVTEMATGILGHPGVEAELGRIGGKEDDLKVEVAEDPYTDPDQAAHFVSETGIDSLAVAIGTAHGFYKGTPKLDFERLEQLREAVAVPLVLHGASGIPDEDVAYAISQGVCKVNFATELRAAYTQAVRECLKKDERLYDPKKFGERAREAVTALVRHRIKVCGANGRI